MKHPRDWPFHLQLPFIILIAVGGIVAIESVRYYFSPAPRLESIEHCPPQNFKICVPDKSYNNNEFCTCWLNDKGMEDYTFWLDKELKRIESEK